MININFKNRTYVCPFCGCKQAFSTDCSSWSTVGYNLPFSHRDQEQKLSDMKVYHIRCNNKRCNKITVLAIAEDGRQWDLIPQNVHKNYPEYIPQQIRDDYVEACSIISNSPKAAATLLRRCLQGMIHDFWDIHGKNLNAEVTQLKDRVSPTQWRAIDGLRQIGNIGAHMEHDVNLIVDIAFEDAYKLQKLIELLLEKWYISRYEEELLYSEISNISDDKQTERKG